MVVRVEVPFKTEGPLFCLLTLQGGSELFSLLSQGLNTLSPVRRLCAHQGQSGSQERVRSTKEYKEDVPDSLLTGDKSLIILCN